MLLALLMLVVGLLGGALGGPPMLVFETERAMGGAMPRLSRLTGLVRSGIDREAPMGGGTLDRPPMGGGGVEVGIGGVPVEARDMPLGGGGVAVLASETSAPDFLLTHRFKSGSYTKLLASPSLARIGLFGDCSPTAGVSTFLPPNQPPKPHPFFPPCCAAARLAK